MLACGLLMGITFSGSAHAAPAIAKIGVFLNGAWYLDLDGNGSWYPEPVVKITSINHYRAHVDTSYSFGMAGDIPVAGDWTGDGMKKIGVFRSGIWYLDMKGDGVWDGGLIDKVYTFGTAGDIPVVGDWTGDGRDKIGVFRNGTWYLDMDGDGVWQPFPLVSCPSVSPCTSPVDTSYSFGMAGDIPVVGDWTGDGITKIGVFRSGMWYLDMDGNGSWNPEPLCQCPAGSPCLTAVDAGYAFGMAGDYPVVGDWTGDGRAKIGVYRNGAWYLDTNGNFSWDGPQIDRVIPNFGAGLPYVVPVVVN